MTLPDDKFFQDLLLGLSRPEPPNIGGSDPSPNVRPQEAHEVVNRSESYTRPPIIQGSGPTPYRRTSGPADLVSSSQSGSAEEGLARIPRCPPELVSSLAAKLAVRFPEELNREETGTSQGGDERRPSTASTKPSAPEKITLLSLLNEKPQKAPDPKIAQYIISGGSPTKRHSIESGSPKPPCSPAKRSNSVECGSMARSSPLLADLLARPLKNQRQSFPSQPRLCSETPQAALARKRALSQPCPSRRQKQPEGSGMAPLVPIEGLASRLINTVDHLPPAREQKPLTNSNNLPREQKMVDNIDQLPRDQKTLKKEPSVPHWSSLLPQMLLNPTAIVNDLGKPIEQSEEFQIALNDSKLADIVDNEMKRANWLDIAQQQFRPSSSTNIPRPTSAPQHVTSNASNQRIYTTRAPKPTNEGVYQYQPQAGNWIRGQRLPSSSGRRCSVSSSTSPPDPQGAPIVAPRMPIRQMNPQRGRLDQNYIPGSSSQRLIGPRPSQTFVSAPNSNSLADVKPQLRAFETQSRPTTNPISPSTSTGAFDFNPESSGFILPQNSQQIPRNQDQADIDFILHGPSPSTGPTFSIEILADQGVNLSSRPGPSGLEPRVVQKESGPDPLQHNNQPLSIGPPSMADGMNKDVRDIFGDLLEEVSKLSPPKNPVNTEETSEQANTTVEDKPTIPTMNTVNLSDLQDIGLRFKEPIGSLLVMDDMSQLQVQLSNPSWL